ncbi:alpha/beta fold hydrolase [Rhodococcus aerolatus]
MTAEPTPEPTAEPLPVVLPDGTALPATVHPGPPGAPVLVVLPGIGVAARSYRHLAAALVQRGLQAVVVELRGQGSSTQVGRGSTHGYHALASEDVPAVLAATARRLPGAPLLLLGHSLGGQVGVIAAALAADRGAPPAGVVLVAAATPHFRAYPPVLAARNLLGTSAVAAVAGALGYWPGDRLRFAGRQSRVLVRDWARLARTGRYAPAGAGETDYEALLPRLAVPVLAVSLARDGMAPARAVDRWAQRLPAAALTRAHVPEPLGHTGWLRRPGAVADLVAAWWAAGRGTVGDNTPTP